jgi:hypothetical protein
MATIEELHECHRSVLALLEEHEVQPPDEIEYGQTCIRVFWHQPKLVLIVSVDDPPYWATEDPEIAGDATP